MRATQDFNYKVALASGLKSLQAGRLRQAEEQFRYLVEKFPGSSGGYRGLAKVLVELEDRAAAFAILRDGGTGLAKAGDRDGAIALFREAVGVEPRDATTHRRLAAALSLAGDLDGAVAEVERYVEAQSGPAGDADRARIEVAYAVETLGEHRRLAELAQRFGVSQRASPRAAMADPDAEPAARGGRAIEPAAGDVRQAFDGAAEPGVIVAQQRERAAAERTSAAPTAATPAPTAVTHAPTAATPAPAAASAPAEPEDLEERAATLIARRDPGALRAGLAAARWHLSEGRTNAASDLLLQLISSGLGDHETHRALLDVARDVGRPDLAREKSALLAEVERLAGKA